MYLFLILIIPLFAGAVVALDKNYTFRNFVPQAVAALLLATVICCIKEFFIYSHHLWIDSVAQNFMQLFLNNILLPVLTLGTLHFVLVKDDANYKAASLFALLAMFYAVLIPYETISSMERHSKFLLLYRPILFAGFSLLASVFFRFAASAKKSMRISLFIAAAILSLGAGIIPPLLETYRYFNGESFLLYALSLAYTGFALALFLIKNIKKQDID